MSVGPEGYTPAPVDPPVRFLDPSQVRRRPHERAVGSTWYVADRLIVHGEIPAEVRRRLEGPQRTRGRAAVLELRRPDEADQATRLEQKAWQQGCSVAFETRLRGTGDSTEPDVVDPDEVDDAYGYVLRLVPDEPGTVPDAWEALEADAADERTSWRLSLDHVMRVTPYTSQPYTSQPYTSQPYTSQPYTSQPYTSQPYTSQPYTSQPYTSQPHTSQPYTSQPFRGLPEYGVPGSGGRTPVHRFGPPPTRSVHESNPRLTADGTRRPVVAVVDSGVGSHPWFGQYSLDPEQCTGADVVLRDATLPDGPIGTYPVPGSAAADAEIGGTSIFPLTGPLDPIAGHGTFIAGIVHQVCPDALILPVRAVGGVGVTAESDVHESLRRLAQYHARALEAPDDDPVYVPVDVVVLSMGYYHEQPEDLQWDHPLAAVLAELRDAGVAVVTSAGNDGETRPQFPAAFAPLVDRRGDEVRIRDAKDASATRTPILTVGAANPDGSTALFSNDGPWVTCVRAGANVLSAVPKTLDGPITPSVRIAEQFGDGTRSTIDPEGFQSGFAIWSGTSFAAPVLAGEIAQNLLELRRAPGEHGADRVVDAWNAIRTAVPLADD